MTSLITGGAGFIGSHITHELLSLGEKVIVIDDLSGGFLDNISDPRIIFIKGSVTDSDLIKKVFIDYKPDHIFHLAAYAAEGLSHFIKHFNYENNLLGSINIINAAVNNHVKVLVFTSSIAVYGSNIPPMKEDMTPSPEDSYGIAKYAVEQELMISHKLFGLNYMIFRPHNVYGEFQNIGDRYRNVIGIFMNQILQNKPITIFGDGLQTRAFSYIKDVAPIIAQSVFSENVYNNIFNIGADQPYTVLEIAKLVSKIMGVEANIQFLPERNEVKNAFASHQKLTQYFNPPPVTPIEQGIKSMAEWVKEIGPRKSKSFSNIEIREHLPSSWLDDIKPV